MTFLPPPFFSLSRLVAHGEKKCRDTRQPLSSPWVVARNGWPLSRQAAEPLVPADVLALLDDLNENLPDAAGDEPGVGLVDTAHAAVSPQRTCDYGLRKWRVNKPVLARGPLGRGPRLDARVRQAACRPRGLNKPSPALAAFLRGRLGGEKPAPIFTPEEEAARVRSRGARETGRGAGSGRREAAGGCPRASRDGRQRHRLGVVRR